MAKAKKDAVKKTAEKKTSKKEEKKEKKKNVTVTAEKSTDENTEKSAKNLVKKTAKETTEKDEKKTEKESVVEKKEDEVKLTKAETGIAEKSKQDIIEEFALKKGDTGSPEVQIALSTQKIFNLQKHLQENPKDNHSRRGLLKIISKRRRILHYLQDKDEVRYKGLIKSLGLKK